MCRRLSIAGTEELQETALRFVGEPTSDISHVNVYLTSIGKSLYLQSNYVTAGFEHPTKLLTSQTDLSLRTLTANLIFSDSKEWRKRSRSFDTAFETTITFFLDQDALADGPVRPRSFSDVRRIRIVAHNGDVLPAEVLLTPMRPWLIVELSKGLYARAELQDLAAVRQFFSKPAPRVKDVVLVQLEDGPSLDSLREFGPEAHVAHATTPTDLDRLITARSHSALLAFGNPNAVNEPSDFSSEASNTFYLSLTAGLPTEHGPFVIVSPTKAEPSGTLFLSRWPSYFKALSNADGIDVSPGKSVSRFCKCAGRPDGRARHHR